MLASGLPSNSEIATMAAQRHRRCYRIVPESGPAYVSDDEAAKRPGTALADNLRASIEKGPVKFRLRVQLAAADDPTTDATKVWPDSRPTVEFGEIAITRALDTKKVENGLLFRMAAKCQRQLTDGTSNAKQDA